MWCRTVSYRILTYVILSYLIFCLTVSYLILFDLILPYLILSYLILSYLIRSDRIGSDRIESDLIWSYHSIIWFSLLLSDLILQYMYRILCMLGPGVVSVRCNVYHQASAARAAPNGPRSYIQRPGTTFVWRRDVTAYVSVCLACYGLLVAQSPPRLGNSAWWQGRKKEDCQSTFRDPLAAPQ